MKAKKQVEFYRQMYLDICEVYTFLDIDDAERLQMITDILCALETSIPPMYRYVED